MVRVGPFFDSRCSVDMSMPCVFLACLRIPKLLCFVWYSLDVFFTSSTICHLCMISIDRYMALKFPLRYGLATSKRRTVIKISIVWVVSFCIAGPLFVLSTLDSRQSLQHYKGTVTSSSLWPPYVIGGHYIFALRFLSIYLLLFFFPRLISAAAGWMSTIL